VNKSIKELEYNVPLVVFARGAHYALKSLSELEYSVVSVDWTVAPDQARHHTHGKVTLQGNADPSLLYADPPVIRSTVKKMLAGFGTQRRYIANLGHGMYPDHDPEHLKAYLEAIVSLLVIVSQQNSSNSTLYVTEGLFSGIQQET
jgi:uroporphyrinogen decarboxylase